MENKKVYVVTRGESSDYHIEAVFSTRELAEVFSEESNIKNRDWSYKSEIEEWDLDKPKEKWGVYVVRMNKDGIVTEAPYEFNGNEGFCGFDSLHDLVWGVAANNRESAIKVVNGKRAQILALGIWENGEKVGEMIK
jgi:hypothetical protein